MGHSRQAGNRCLLQEKTDIHEQQGKAGLGDQSCGGNGKKMWTQKAALRVKGTTYKTSHRSWKQFRPKVGNTED